MPAALAFCRLVLGSPEPAAAAAAAAAPGVDRVGEIAGAWLACRPELERRRDAFAWGEAASAQPAGVAARLGALPELERAAVAAQALGLEPGEIERALGAEPGAVPGLLARAHASLAALAGSGGAACVRERERLASAPPARRSARADHCTTCRAFRFAVDRQRLELRRAAGAEPDRLAPPPSGRADVAAPAAPSPAARRAEPEAAPPRVAPRRREEPAPPASAAPRRSAPAAPAAAPVRRGEPARPAAAPPGRGKAAKALAQRLPREAAKALEALRRRVQAAAGSRRRGDAEGTGGRPRAAPAARGSAAPRAGGRWGRALARLEPEGRGPRAALAVAVVLGSGLAGFGAVNAVETPREGGDDPGVVTATPVGPLPPGVGPTEP